MPDFFLNFMSSVLASITSLLFGKSTGNETELNKTTQKGGESNVGVNYGHVEKNITINDSSRINQVEYKFKDMDSNLIKKNARVLFVDDQSQANTIKNLRDNLGWKNIDQLGKEYLQNTTCEQYREADLIFVDFDGVGPSKQGQGLSILNSLRTNYGREKFYILYTAHPQKITLQKLEDCGLAIQDNVGWAQLTKGSPDYLLETTMMHGLKQIEK